MSIREFKCKVRRKINGILNRWAMKRFTHVDSLATWMFNLRCFDLRTALKRPVFIYNDVQIITLGKVIIDAKHIHKGMIRIGNWPVKAHNKTKIHQSGTIIFHGACEIWGGITIQGCGILEFGDNSRIAESCQIMCDKHVKIGNNVSVGYETTFMDTDYHFVIDTVSHTVHPKKGEVIVGDGTWISSTCKIMKGSRLPMNSVVSGGSLVNKDFSDEEPCTVFVGTPAKPVKRNKRRIFNKKAEADISRYFNEHPDEKTKVLDVEDIDAFCVSNFFYGNKNKSLQM